MNYKPGFYVYWFRGTSIRRHVQKRKRIFYFSPYFLLFLYKGHTSVKYYVNNYSTQNMENWNRNLLIKFRFTAIDYSLLICMKLKTPKYNSKKLISKIKKMEPKLFTTYGITPYILYNIFSVTFFEINCLIRSF